MKPNKVDICPVDLHNLYWDIPNIISNLQEELKKEKPVEAHIH